VDKFLSFKINDLFPITQKPQCCLNRATFFNYTYSKLIKQQKEKNMQTLKEIYGTAKNKNKLYQKRSFADFIQDFGNCGDEFFDSVNQYHKWIMKKENYQSWYGFYKKYYSTNN
jgi:hypothetical protein